MKSQPNILFMIADDHRHNAIHTLGDPIVQTPILDSLVAGGTAFCQNHIMGSLSGAVCIPTRACLHTGANLFNASTSTELSNSRGIMTLNPDLTLLAEHFRVSGYHTFATGKWHNDKASFNRSFGEGSTIFFGGMSDHDRVPLHEYDSRGEYSQDNCYIGDGFSSEIFSDSAIQFLNQYEEQEPFFLYVAFTAPHDPRTPPPEYAVLYDPAEIPLPPNYLPEHPFDNGELDNRDENLAPFPRPTEEVQQHMADYYGMISHMDAQIGRVIETLSENGYLENTIIVYTADHGLAVGQHGLFGKQNLYDHSIRVPLILKGPGVPSGEVIDGLTHTNDVYPTLCELAQVSIPETVESQSLLPLLQGQQRQFREYVCSAYKYVQRSISDSEWKLIRYYRSEESQTGEERIQLFNLAQDPWEMNDLSADPSQQTSIQNLSEKLTSWMGDVDDPLLQTTNN